MHPFNRRLRWLERDGGGDAPVLPLGPRLIRIVGGLPEPANATIDGRRIDIAEDESIEAFERRAIEAGYEAGANFVILAGYDAEAHLSDAPR